MDDNNVRVLEFAGGLRLAVEALEQVRITQEAGRDGLQRDKTTYERVASLVDDAHGAASHFLNDLVLTDLLDRIFWHNHCFRQLSPTLLLRDLRHTRKASEVSAGKEFRRGSRVQGELESRGALRWDSDRNRDGERVT